MYVYTFMLKCVRIFGSCLHTNIGKPITFVKSWVYDDDDDNIYILSLYWKLIRQKTCCGALYFRWVEVWKLSQYAYTIDRLADIDLVCLLFEKFYYVAYKVN